VPFKLQILDRLPAAAFLVFAFRVTHHTQIRDFLTTYFGGVIALLAKLTLQIYLLHGYILGLKTLQTIAFPANIVVFSVATVVMALLFERLSFRSEKRVPNSRELQDSDAYQAKALPRNSSKQRRDLLG
jgi:hypothetical protein